MDFGEGVPSWMQPGKPRRLTLQELQEERKRLEEVNKINRLNAERNKLLIAQKNTYFRERQAKIQAVKQVGSGVVSVFKGAVRKVGEFDDFRAKAKPFIVSPFKKKSIYD